VAGVRTSKKDQLRNRLVGGHLIQEVTVSQKFGDGVEAGEGIPRVKNRWRRVEEEDGGI
jgi:hypothetical protein